MTTLYQIMKIFSSFWAILLIVGVVHPPTLTTGNRSWISGFKNLGREKSWSELIPVLTVQEMIFKEDHWTKGFITIIKDKTSHQRDG